MFRQISGEIPDTTKIRAEKLFKLHPTQLAILLEQAWRLRKHDVGKSLGHPDHRSDLTSLNELKGSSALEEFAWDKLCNEVRWDHLIYAYLIENTRIYEIFERVVREFLHGEQLGVPTVDGEHWLRNTEELFYKDPAPFLITAAASQVRPDLRATRRNAYYRMFGMDLNHGIDDKKEYPYIKAKAGNNDFVATFENFLREVWVGISNASNISGTNPTDPSTIANLADRLRIMLISRRLTGNLSREEFYAVSAMSWFHLALEEITPIVKDLRADASSPEERLFKIAERVKLPAHGLSRSYFELADRMSRILTLIETGLVSTSTSAMVFYLPTDPPSKIIDDMNTIITHWSIITGHDLKTRKTQVTA
jgi:hypothetical protein